MSHPSAASGFLFVCNSPDTKENGEAPSPWMEKRYLLQILINYYFILKILVYEKYLFNYLINNIFSFI
jgi:hypothetical protein